MGTSLPQNVRCRTCVSLKPKAIGRAAFKGRGSDHLYLSSPDDFDIFFTNKFKAGMNKLGRKWKEGLAWPSFTGVSPITPGHCMFPIFGSHHVWPLKPYQTIYITSGQQSQSAMGFPEHGGAGAVTWNDGVPWQSWQ